MGSTACKSILIICTPGPSSLSTYLLLECIWFVKQQHYFFQDTDIEQCCQRASCKITFHRLEDWRHFWNLTAISVRDCCGCTWCMRWDGTMWSLGWPLPVHFSYTTPSLSYLLLYLVMGMIACSNEKVPFLRWHGFYFPDLCRHIHLQDGRYACTLVCAGRDKPLSASVLPRPSKFCFLRFVVVCLAIQSMNTSLFAVFRNVTATLLAWNICFFGSRGKLTSLVTSLKSLWPNVSTFLTSVLSSITAVWCLF